MQLEDGKSFSSVDEWRKHIESKYTWFEKHIEIPFYQNVWNPISTFYYGLIHLPGNIKRWYKVVWNYRVWDSGYTLDALKVGLEGQLESLEASKIRGWCSVHVDRDIKDVKITIELIRRMQEDVYCEKDPVVFKSNHYEKLSKVEKQDMELLGEQMKKIRRWWD
jgi:hypothetical protein